MKQALKNLENDPFIKLEGEVIAVKGDFVRLMVPEAKVGSICEIENGNKKILVEIVSLDPEGHIAMPLDSLEGVQLGAKVHLSPEPLGIRVGPSLLGRVIDSTGEAYESDVSLHLPQKSPLYGVPVNPLDREIISDPLDLGVRSINNCLTCGRGQRQGIFAGAGVGKSVLLGMMARYTSADVVVIGLVGERGREVREFIERDLGAEGMKRSVVVVETSEKSAIRRSRAAFVATAVAEFYREQGKHVLLMMDSLTRFAMARREIGMASGEPPTAKGYTPSVFSALAKLVERAGNWGDEGSITGLYSVLVEGDAMDDPVADNCRALLDGHIVLSRDLANQGHFPAVDVVESVSRVMDQVVNQQHVLSARRLKEIIARYRANADAIQYGMYVQGTDPHIDEAMALYPKIMEFLKQAREESTNFSHDQEALLALLDQK